MPRKKIIRTDQWPYHVTARCHNKEWFKLPLDEVWDIMGRYLYFIQVAFGVRVLAFVLMDNHIHILLETPRSNLDEAMNYFMRETSRYISRRCGRINQVYGAPYYWCSVQSPDYYWTAYKYLLRNPVMAGKCKRVEDYQWSTLRGMLGLEHLDFPVYPPDEFFESTEAHVDWLNTPFANELEETVIRKALKKRIFEFGKEKNGKKPALVAKPC